jgi:hypothetical protein
MGNAIENMNKDNCDQHFESILSNKPICLWSLWNIENNTNLKGAHFERKEWHVLEIATFKSRFVWVDRDKTCTHNDVTNQTSKSICGNLWFVVVHWFWFLNKRACANRCANVNFDLDNCMLHSPQNLHNASIWHAWTCWTSKCSHHVGMPFVHSKHAAQMWVIQDARTHTEDLLSHPSVHNGPPKARETPWKTAAPVIRGCQKIMRWQPWRLSLHMALGTRRLVIIAVSSLLCWHPR